MVHDEGIINQSKPVTLNNEENLDRISHTLVFYVNGKEVCNYIIFIVLLICIVIINIILIICIYYILYNTFKFMHAYRKNNYIYTYIIFYFKKNKKKYFVLKIKYSHKY